MINDINEKKSSKMDYNKLKRNHREKIFNSFKIFLISCKLFCVTPIILNFKIKKKIKYFINCIQLICTTFIISSVIVSTHYQHIQFDTTMGFLTRVLYMGEYFFGILNMFLIMYGCHYQRKFYLIYINQLTEIDMKLLKCGVKVNLKFMTTYFKLYLSVFTGFFVFVLFVDFKYNRLNAVSFFRSSTVYTIPNLISVLALTQYSAILYFVRIKFRQINEILENFAKKIKINNKIPPITDKLNILSVIHFSKTNNDQDDYENIINTLRITHGDLCILASEVSFSFGILILSTLAGSFVILSIQFYAIYKISEGYTGDDFYLTIYTILWIVLHGGKICLILFSSNGVNNEKSETGSILYKIDTTDKLTDHMQLVIDKFSMQLLHEKRCNSACSIIELDLTLLNTIAGALTTYLVILIQFDAGARLGDKNVTNSTTLTTDFTTPSN